MPDSGMHRQLAEIVKKEFPNARVTSTFRPSSGPHHGTGNAADFAGPFPMDTATMQRIFEFLVKNYPGSAEIIYTPGGARQIKNGQPHRYSSGVAATHFNHVHWAVVDMNVARGGVATTPGTIPVNNGGGVGTGGVLPDFLPFASGVNELIDTVNFVTGAVNFFTNPKMWLRVGIGIVGLIAIGMAALSLLRGKLVMPGDVVKATKKVVKSQKAAGVKKAAAAKATAASAVKGGTNGTA